MICRKCSAIIPDGSEKCPVCNKNPGKSTGKTKSKILTGITFIVCFLFASALIALGIKASDNSFNKLKSEFSSEVSTNHETKETTLKSIEPDITDASGLLPIPEIKTTAVFSSDISSYKKGEVSFDKDVFKEITLDEFKLFINNEIKGKNFCWFTINFNDSTGIVFRGTDLSVISYGSINQDGEIKETFGYILLKTDGDYVYREIQRQSSIFETTEISEETSEAEIASQSEDESITDTTENEEENSSDTTEEESANTVYVTPSGKKYHKASCRYISSTSTALSLSEAKAKGYDACKVCKP